MRTLAFTSAVVLLALGQTGCSTMNNTEKGIGLGAAGGAGAGALLGSATGHGKEGAIIGGLAGAGLGGLIGHDVDRQEKRDKERELAAVAYDQAQPARIEEIVTMAKNGQSDRVIITHIRQNRMHFTLGAADLNYLKQSGVPDTVIVEMQSGPPTRPVVVREQVIVRDPYYAPRPVVFIEPYGPPYRHRRW